MTEAVEKSSRPEVPTGARSSGSASGGFGGAIVPLTTIVIGVALFLTVTQPNFATISNINSILFGVSIQFLAIIGFTYLMVMHEIDLSVGSVFALTGTMTGALLIEGWGLWPAAIVSLAAAAFVGFVNGFLVVRFRINSLMLTIGTLLLVRGLSNVLAHELGGRTYPRDFRNLARVDLFDIRITIVVMLVAFVAAWVFQKRSALYRKMCFIGENVKSATVHGIAVNRIKVLCFVASSVTAGLGGIFTASRITHADVKMGLGLEFVMVTAAIIGGASLYGGRGDLRGSALGLILLALVLNGMIMFDIEPVFQQFVIGALLIGTVTFDTLANRRNR